MPQGHINLNFKAYLMWVVFEYLNLYKLRIIYSTNANRKNSRQ